MVGTDSMVGVLEAVGLRRPEEAVYLALLDPPGRTTHPLALAAGLPPADGPPPAAAREARGRAGARGACTRPLRPRGAHRREDRAHPACGRRRRAVARRRAERQARHL